MRSKRISWVLLVAGLAITVASCGSGGTSPTQSFGGGTGSVALLGGDSPVCDVLSFRVTITGVTLTPQGGGTPVTVVSSQNPVTLDFASLQDFAAFLTLVKVPAGTYTQLTITLSNPSLSILDFTVTPPAPKTLTVNLSALTFTLTLSPALTVADNGVASLNLDLNLAKSLTVSQGILTGGMTPSFTALPVNTPATTTGLGELDDLHGLVQSVSTTSTNPAFSGSIVVGVNVASGATVTVQVTSSTVFNGVSGLGTLLPNTFVEIAAIVDSNGNIVANRVTAESVEDVGISRAGFAGLVTSVTRVSGNATQFTLAVREEFPDVSSSVPLFANLNVTLAPSAAFNIAATEANFANLSFDPTTLGVGQSVVAHGTFQAAVPPSVPASLNADTVYLRLQSVGGNFVKTLLVGTDNKTGGFQLTPCSDLFLGQSMNVITTSTTNFLGVSGLNTLTTTPTLVTKGLVFFEPTLTAVGSVPLTPPSYVVLAKQVHQLP